MGKTAEQKKNVDNNTENNNKINEEVAGNEHTVTRKRNRNRK